MGREGCALYKCLKPEIELSSADKMTLLEASDRERKVRRIARSRACSALKSESVLLGATEIAAVF